MSTTFMQNNPQQQRFYQGQEMIPQQFQSDNSMNQSSQQQQPQQQGQLSQQQQQTQPQPQQSYLSNLTSSLQQGQVPLLTQQISQQSSQMDNTLNLQSQQQQQQQQQPQAQQLTQQQIQMLQQQQAQQQQQAMMQYNNNSSNDLTLQQQQVQQLAYEQQGNYGSNTSNIIRYARGGNYRQTNLPVTPSREWRRISPPQIQDIHRFIRVVSWNLMMRGRIKKSHIPTWMEWESSRGPLIITELLQNQPDIICLQEVDRFEYLEEQLAIRGYIGIYERRSLPLQSFYIPDGLAIFWRTDKFELIGRNCQLLNSNNYSNNYSNEIALCARLKRRDPYNKDSSLGEIDVWNTQFSSGKTSKDEVKRVNQAVKLFELMACASVIDLPNKHIGNDNQLNTSSLSSSSNSNSNKNSPNGKNVNLNQDEDENNNHHHHNNKQQHNKYKIEDIDKLKKIFEQKMNHALSCKQLNNNNNNNSNEEIKKDQVENKKKNIYEQDKNEETDQNQNKLELDNQDESLLQQQQQQQSDKLEIGDDEDDEQDLSQGSKYHKQQEWNTRDASLKMRFDAMKLPQFPGQYTYLLRPLILCTDMHSHAFPYEIKVLNRNFHSNNNYITKPVLPWLYTYLTNRSRTTVNNLEYVRCLNREWHNRQASRHTWILQSAYALGLHGKEPDFTTFGFTFPKDIDKVNKRKEIIQQRQQYFSDKYYGGLSPSKYNSMEEKKEKDADDDQNNNNNNNALVINKKSSSSGAPPPFWTGLENDARATDLILFSPQHFRVINLLETLDRNWIQQQNPPAIPNVYYPSDHFLIGVDFELAHTGPTINPGMVTNNPNNMNTNININNPNQSMMNPNMSLNTQSFNTMPLNTMYNLPMQSMPMTNIQASGGGGQVQGQGQGQIPLQGQMQMQMPLQSQAQAQQIPSQIQQGQVQGQGQLQGQMQGQGQGQVQIPRHIPQQQQQQQQPSNPIDLSMYQRQMQGQVQGQGQVQSQIPSQQQGQGLQQQGQGLQQQGQGLQQQQQGPSQISNANINLANMNPQQQQQFQLYQQRLLQQQRMQQQQQAQVQQQQQQQPSSQQPQVAMINNPMSQSAITPRMSQQQQQQGGQQQINPQQFR